MNKELLIQGLEMVLKALKDECKPEPEYLVGRHYVACLEDYGIHSHTAGIVRYEGYGLFARHRTSIQVPKEVFAWITQPLLSW